MPAPALLPVDVPTSPQVLLESGAVAVRLVDLAEDDAAPARAEALLTPAEAARARRGTAAVYRRRVLLRAALRRALAGELGVAPRDVPLGATPAGRPFPVGSPGLDVSCSAAGTLGVVVVGRRCLVGVDVERVAAWSPDVLDEGWLSRAEQDALLGLPPRARAVAATRSWTQKEAVLKARGRGLLESPAAVETVPGRSTGLVAGWAISDVPVPEGWLASLATRPHEEPS